MISKRWFFVLAAAAVLAAAPPQKKTTAPVHARSGATASLPDVELEKAIRARFAASKISVNNFQVRVQGGVATIEGKTDVLQHKGTATRLAKNMGAVKVINNVQITQAARDKAAENLTKGRRRAQVQRDGR